VRVTAEDMSWSSFNQILIHLNVSPLHLVASDPLLQSLSYSDTPNYNLIRLALDQILLPTSPPSAFPSAEEILQQEPYADHTPLAPSPSPDWMLSEVPEKTPSHVQDILMLPNPLTSRLMIPRIWSSLVRSLLRLPEEEIKWKTVQSLQSILKQSLWFYSYGTLCSDSLSPPPPVGDSSSCLSFSWSDFCVLQEVSSPNPSSSTH
jgi:hypothetical protein